MLLLAGVVTVSAGNLFPIRESGRNGNGACRRDSGLQPMRPVPETI